MNPSPADEYWLGFDLGGTKMLATVFDASFKSLGRKRRRTKGNEGADQGIERIALTIQQALDDAKIDVEQLSGIGIGAPSPVAMDEGLLLDAVNLGWQDVELKRILEAKFGVPVELLNDVDAGIYGEYRFGAAKKAYSVLGVFPGTGIGGGGVYRGEIIHGRKISCMEVGHVQVEPSGNLCGCGQRGCLETVASRLAISAEVAKAAFRGEAPEVLADAGCDLSRIRSGVLASAIKNGNPTVEAIVRRAVRYLGEAIAGFVHLWSPDIIVLGGGLVEAMPELFQSEVEASSRRRVMAAYADTFEIRTAQLGDDSSVLGAAAWVQHRVHGRA